MVGILYKMMARKKIAMKNWIARHDIQDIKSLIPIQDFQIDCILHDKYYTQNRGKGFLDALDK